jgi:hypothetical protein
MPTFVRKLISVLMTARLKSGNMDLGTRALQSGGGADADAEGAGGGGGAIPTVVDLLVGLMLDEILDCVLVVIVGATLGCQYSVENGSMEWSCSSESKRWLAASL